MLSITQVVLLYAAFRAAGTSNHQQPAINYCVVLDDNFDLELDTNTWKREVKRGGGNGDFQWYSDSPNNSFTKDGNLYLMPTFTSDNIGKKDGKLTSLPIQSASLTTKHSASIKYGKVEIRAKLPIGDYMWPAIWMLPLEDKYGGWPASGELDLMENRGNAPGCTDKDASQNKCVVGRDSFGATLNWGTEPLQNRWYLSHAAYTIPGGSGVSLADDYHVYGMIWSNTSISLYIDSTPILTYELKDFYKRGHFNPGTKNPWPESNPAAPFDQEFYLILNIAVGGTNGYFPDNVPNKPWNNSSPTAALDFWNNKDSTWGPTWPEDLSRGMAVDYVKMWREC